jgi:syntaxin 18
MDSGASSDDSDDDDMELSQSQMQQFEEENAAILREAQDALATVQQAESRLMEISALQMELVSHLTQQAEITDQLYEDAIEAGATVSAGNKQLVEARRRQKDSRLFILVFLIGATMALLFLHNY